MTYKDGLKHASIGVGIALTLIYTAATVTGVSVYRMNEQPYSAITIEIAKMVAGETRAQCSKIKARNYKIQADGLTIVAGCTK